MKTFYGTEVDGDMTLTFEPERISGSDGCNTFSADYTISSNGALDISDNIASTMMACPDRDGEMAQQYLTALAGATGFTHDGDSLTIQIHVDKDGRAIRFALRPNQSVAEHNSFCMVYLKNTGRKDRQS